MSLDVLCGSGGIASRFRLTDCNAPLNGFKVIFGACLEPAVPTLCTPHSAAVHPDGAVRDGVARRAGWAGDNHGYSHKHGWLARDKRLTCGFAPYCPFFHIHWSL